MTLALFCVFLAALLPIVCAGIAKWGRKDYDNADPRQWEAKLDGYRKRAIAAQANSWEAFPFFAVAVLVATYLKANPVWLNALAMTFVAARVLYLWAYVTDRASLRSSLWFVSWAACVWIFFLGT
jgi:uncharacterized MAPEG superfamily protein